MSKTKKQKQPAPKAKKPETKKPAEKKKDLNYDETAYDDRQAWQRNEGIDLEPDESDNSTE